MTSTSCVLVLLVCGVLVSPGIGCPTWFYYQDAECVCGADLGGIVTCDNKTQEVGVLINFCMTYNGINDGILIVGKCFNPPQNLFDKGLYFTIPQNASELESVTCHTLNRRGRLCGMCRENFYLQAYSYDQKCVQCTSSVMTNVLLYIGIAYIPLTVLFLLIFIFRINISSPQLNSAVVVSQIFASPTHLRGLIFRLKNTKLFVFVQILATVYGIWNLDFFRTIIPPICLPLNSLEILALDYLVAIYPLVLLLVFYALITAHERGIRAVVFLLRPLHHISAGFRRQWNIKRSVIDAFASFIVLSYMKVLNTSADLLVFTDVRDMYGVWKGNYLYIDSSIAFFSPEHRPYAICAVLLLVVVILLPMALLILYPMQCFQKCLNKLGLNSPTLREFMQCFQGYYRDRTDGGVECRYYAVIYPAIRIVGLIAYSITLDVLFFPLLIALLLGAELIIVLVAPYRHPFQHYNKFDFFILLMITVYCVCLMAFSLDYENKINITALGIILGIIAFIPAVYLLVVLICFLKRCLRAKFGVVCA